MVQIMANVTARCLGVFFKIGKKSSKDVERVSTDAIIVPMPSASIMRKNMIDQSTEPLIVVTANG